MNNETITNQARELLDGRLSVIDTLANANTHRDELRTQLAEAESASAAAWGAATQAGWTSRELRQLGFTQPVTRAGGRPKGSRNKARLISQTVESPQADVTSQ